VSWVKHIRDGLSLGGLDGRCVWWTMMMHIPMSSVVRVVASQLYPCSDCVYARKRMSFELFHRT
jgi:hypothetical protein